MGDNEQCDQQTKQSVWKLQVSHSGFEGLNRLWVALKMENWLFLSFQVGTLDQLVGLSDDLGKLDAYVEGVCRKLAQYLGDVLEDSRDKWLENLLANNSKSFLFCLFCLTSQIHQIFIVSPRQSIYYWLIGFLACFFATKLAWIAFGKGANFLSFSPFFFVLFKTETKQWTLARPPNFSSIYHFAPSHAPQYYLNNKKTTKCFKLPQRPGSAARWRAAGKSYARSSPPSYYYCNKNRKGLLFLVHVSTKLLLQ